MGVGVKMELSLGSLPDPTAVRLPWPETVTAHSLLLDAYTPGVRRLGGCSPSFFVEEETGFKV